MTMRAPEQEASGTAGASQAKSNFELIGWGVAENSTHDLGTDLFVMVLMARDPRRFDLGQLVGAQVKSGPSWFRSVERNKDGDVVGWWFPADQEHWDAWLSHMIPHLIVLQDLESRISYWVHVTRDAVVSTGKQSKILVPRAQTVDMGHRDQLLAVATSQRPAAAWEGSAWRGAPDISDAEALRFALVTPRLVAPHPNASSVPATPERCLAMLVLGRSGDLRPGTGWGLQDVPEMTEAASSPNWRWRLVAALDGYLRHGDPQQLEWAVTAPRGASEAAAGAVVVANAWLECGQPADAARILQTLVDGDRCATVDHRWLQAQLARARAEQNRLLEARDLALDVQRVRYEYPHDASATAIAGAAANLVFSVSDYGDADLADVVTAADSMASWWRAQVLSWGLGQEATEMFQQWAGKEPSDAGRDDLRAAALMAGFTSDLSGWRHATSRLGRHRLMLTSSDSDSTEVSEGLTLMCRAGDHDGLRAATLRVMREGPAASVTEAAHHLRLELSTRTSLRADWALLTAGGDVVAQHDADRHVGWLLGAVANPEGPFSDRRATVQVATAIEAVGRLVQAGSIAIRQLIVDTVLDLDRQSDQDARAWAKVVRQIPAATWTVDDADRATRVAEAHQAELRYALRGAAARRLPGILGSVVDEAITRPDAAADAAIGDIRRLTVGQAEQVAAVCLDQLQRLDSKDPAAVHGFDWLRLLTIVSLNFSAAADWSEVLARIAAPIGPDELTASVEALARRAVDIPGSFRDDLTATLKAQRDRLVADDPDNWHGFFTRRDDLDEAITWALAAIQSLTRQHCVDLMPLLLGTVGEQVVATRLIAQFPQPGDLQTLVSLARSSEPRLRSSTAAALGHWAAHHPASAEPVHGVIDRLLDDPGTRIVRSLMSGLCSDNLNALRQHRKKLRDSRSAEVRIRVSELIGDSD